MKRRKPYAQWIESVLSDIFESAETVWEYSLPELAEHAGVSTTTVYNYYHRRVQFHRLTTVFRLCRAVGYDLALAKEGMAAALAKTSGRRRAA